MRTRKTLALLLLFSALCSLPLTIGAADDLKPETRVAFDKGTTAARMEEWTLAVRYFNEARKTAPRAPEVLFNLGLAESKMQGRELRAMVWLNAYLAARPDAPNAAAVKDLRAKLKIKEEATVIKLIEMARKMSIQFPEGTDRYASLADVATLYARSGDVDSARQIAKTIPSDQSGRLWHAHTARAVAEAGSVDGAREIAYGIKDELGRSGSCRDVAVVQAESGDVEGTKVTLKCATEPTDKAEGLLAIGRALHKSGRKEEALKTLLQAQELLHIKPWFVGTQAIYPVGYEDLCRRVAVAQVDMGDMQGAKGTAALIPAGNYNRKEISEYIEGHDKLVREREEAAAREAKARAQKGPKEKIDAWTYLAEYQLNGPLYIDFQNYVQSLSKKTTAGTPYTSTAYVIFDAVRSTAKEILDMQKKIALKEADMESWGTPEQAGTKEGPKS